MVENTNNSNQLTEPTFGTNIILPKAQPEEAQTQNDVSPSTPLFPKNLTQFVYFCQGLSFFFGLTAIIGICINYLKRDAVKGTIYEAHFAWQIRTFWIGIIAGVIGWITAIFLVGFLLIAAVIVWNIYRAVKGYLLLLDDKPIPDPNALL